MLKLCENITIKILSTFTYHCLTSWYQELNVFMLLSCGPIGLVVVPDDFSSATKKVFNFELIVVFSLSGILNDQA